MDVNEIIKTTRFRIADRLETARMEYNAQVSFYHDAVLIDKALARMDFPNDRSLEEAHQKVIDAKRLVDRLEAAMSGLDALKQRAQDVPGFRDDLEKSLRFERLP